MAPDSFDYGPQLALAIAAAREAGALLRAELCRDGGPRGGGDHADIDDEAGVLLCERLRPTGWTIRCEDPKTAPQFQPGKDRRHIWLIDPNDGTSAFLQGWRGSAVSIAALRDGVPVLGVVYAYAVTETGDGDLIAWAEGQPLTRNGVAVDVVKLNDVGLRDSDPGPRVVFVSQSADHNPAANLACVQPARYIAMPSVAYRMARIAVGDGIAGVSLAPTCDWDFAAAHALLRAAGGVLTYERGREVTYDERGEAHAAWLIGGAPKVVDELWSRPWDSVFKRVDTGKAPYTLAWPAHGANVADAGMLHRAQGCLLGQLAGDALGSLVEFRSAAELARSHPNGVREIIDGGVWKTIAGQATDDSELALMLARTLVHQKCYDAKAAFSAYQHWFDSAPFDLGRATAAALGDGRPNDESQANGSLMRISPLAIFAAGAGVSGSGWAQQDSALTHPHDACGWSCAAFVAAVSAAIRSKLTPRECYAVALAEAERLDTYGSVKNTLINAATATHEDYGEPGMGWVLRALQNAFYQLLHARTVEDGVVDTVMRGGDTDTNAAIAGALLGAVHGASAIPAQWRLSVQSCRPTAQTLTRHPRAEEFWPVDVMILAEKLLLAGKGSAS